MIAPDAAGCKRRLDGTRLVADEPEVSVGPGASSPTDQRHHLTHVILHFLQFLPVGYFVSEPFT